MSLIKTKVFEVNKEDLSQTQFVSESLSNDLLTDEVIIKVDKFALTANNISYGVAGELLGYWKFFPSSNPMWGRLPAMGYGEVILSNQPDVKIGERLWGFFPMASHVKVKAGKASTKGFTDVSPHRKGLSPVYASLENINANPLYHPSREDLDILLRGLFTTSWLVDDFMFDHDYFGASQYLITSASSKTSIALAFVVKERGDCSTIGLTSKANRSFVEGLGCYDQVITYDEIDQLDASHASILVDMAGSNQLLVNIHEHYKDQLRFSSRIGATHHDQLYQGEKLSGPEPVFFFAPSQMEKRTKEWGRGEIMKRIGQALIGYMEFGAANLNIKHLHNESDINKVYQQVLAGRADASVGYVVSIG